jgi:hypothetical protein
MPGQCSPGDLAAESQGYSLPAPTREHAMRAADNRQNCNFEGTNPISYRLPSWSGAITNWVQTTSEHLLTTFDHP